MLPGVVYSIDISAAVRLPSTEEFQLRFVTQCEMVV